jgi:hypothetical protein
MSSKIVVIGKGEFGNALVQGLQQAVIASSHATVTVDQVSATKFFSISTNGAGQMLANASFIMYCGQKLSENAVFVATALERARKLSIASWSTSLPLLEFVDWTNPDPQRDSIDGAVILADTLLHLPEQVVWKVTGVGSLDIPLSEVSQVISNIHKHIFLISKKTHLFTSARNKSRVFTQTVKVHRSLPLISPDWLGK